MEEWQAACAPAIASLLMLAEKRQRAIYDLAKMQADGVTLTELLDDAACGGGGRRQGLSTLYQDDPTHYLADTERFLNVVNQLCTHAGIAAIIPQVQQCLNGVKNLQMMSAAFDGDDHFVPVLPDENGKPQNTDRAGAWSFLRNNVEPYLLHEREREVQMDMAGYNR